MRILRSPWVLIGLTAVLQTTVLQHLSLRGTSPDLFLICALYLGLYREKGGKYGFLAGLLQDLSGGRLIGANALAKGLLGLLSEGIQRQFLNLPYPLLLVFFFLASFLDSLLLWFLAKHLQSVDISEELFLRIALFQSLINTAVGPWIALALRRLDEDEWM